MAPQARDELATLDTRISSSKAVLASIEAFAGAADTLGSKIGCWTSDTSMLNRVLVLRAFEDGGEHSAERERTLAAAGSFGCIENL